MSHHEEQLARAMHDMIPGSELRDSLAWVVRVVEAARDAVSPELIIDQKRQDEALDNLRRVLRDG